MPISLKRCSAGVAATAALAFGGVSTAQAAPVFTGGLVNITIVDAVSLENVTVQVPVGVAANVCDVDVAVLAATAERGGTTNCTAQTTQDLPVRFR